MNSAVSREKISNWRSSVLTAVLASIAVCLISILPPGRWFERQSFDVISLGFREVVPADTILIYLDERSHEVLGQPYDLAWDRSLHARLLDRLTTDGVKLVLFDILFDQPSSTPEADRALAAAIKRNGRVILGGNIVRAEEAESEQWRISAPMSELRREANGWGTLSFFPIDSDRVIRRIPAAQDAVFPASWVAATRLQEAEKPTVTELGKTWIHYYGPPGSFPSVSYHQALQPDGIPPGYFHDKVVLVGANFATGFSGSAKDSFPSPFSHLGADEMTGTEVNAHLLSTFRDGLALRRPPTVLEYLTLAILTLGTTCLVGAVRPRLAAAIGGVLIVLASVGTWILAGDVKVWWNWLLYSGGSVPLAVFLSVGRNYYAERKRREAVMRAFGKYLSPEMARQVADAKFDLNPGGVTRRVTAMMTDIAGFSTLAETMTPAEVSRMLIAYFSELTRHVFAHQGTVIQYVGDSVYCVWGAPIDQPRHADLALRAAWEIRAALDGKLFEGRTLRTRIGISTGDALCGNLGSEIRFDYAVIGDNTNLAARIEGANRKLGTGILLSHSTCTALSEDWVLREIGDFVLRGRERPVRLWEPIAKGTIVPNNWVITKSFFDMAIVALRRGDVKQAAQYFLDAKAGGAFEDGPTKFYLSVLTGTKDRPPSNVGSEIHI